MVRVICGPGRVVVVVVVDDVVVGEVVVAGRRGRGGGQRGAGGGRLATGPAEEQDGAHRHPGEGGGDPGGDQDVPLLHARGL